MLAHTQHLFYRAIFDDCIQLDFVASHHVKSRFAIYRSNMFERLRHSLALTFPGVWLLLGEDCANSAACAFIKLPQHLPKTACLHQWGYDFPKFLAQLQTLQALPYLKDYAEFEWRKHLAYYAANAAAIDPHVLKNLSEDEIEHIQLVFLPSVFLLTSCFPLQQIQEMINHPNAQMIDLTTKGTTAVITRQKHSVITLFVPPDMGLFFTCLSQGQTLKQALLQTCHPFPDFDLQAAMYILIKYQMIQEFR